MDKPLVSVCMITYNHKDYIEEAINGVLNQIFDFKIEIVISNDGSTDSTHKIISQYLKNSDNITFKYFNQIDNLGMIENFVFALKACRGKYISFCEGDDYWTDPLKLQKQIEFLETHPNYKVVTGPARQYKQEQNIFKDPKEIKDYSFSYKDLIVRNHCVTCNTTIRNFIISAPKFELFHGMGTDSQIWIRALGKNGKGKYIGQTTAVYRKHEGGVSTQTHRSADTFEKKIAAAKRKINKAIFWNNYYDGEAELSVFKVKKRMYEYMFKLALKNKIPRLSCLYFMQYFRYWLLLKFKLHEHY